MERTSDGVGTVGTMTLMGRAGEQMPKQRLASGGVTATSPVVVVVCVWSRPAAPHHSEILRNANSQTLLQTP